MTVPTSALALALCVAMLVLAAVSLVTGASSFDILPTLQAALRGDVPKG